MAQRLPQLISYEDWRTSADESTMSEWVDGEVIVFMPPKQAHFRLTIFLASLMFWLASTRNLGQVLHAPVEMRLPRSAREPDVMFLSKERLDLLDGLRVNGPADLVIEVISEDSVRRDRIAKFAEYQAAGVGEYWILDPREGRMAAEAWLLDETGRYQPLPPDGQGRIASAAMPGFVFDPVWMSEEWLADPARSFTAAMAALGEDTA